MPYDLLFEHRVRYFEKLHEVDEATRSDVEALSTHTSADTGHFTFWLCVNHIFESDDLMFAQNIQTYFRHISFFIELLLIKSFHQK